LVANGGGGSATFLGLQGIGEYDFVPLGYRPVPPAGRVAPVAPRVGTGQAERAWISGRAGQGNAARQMLPMPQRGHVDGSPPAPPRLGARALPHGGTRRAVDRGGAQGHGRLSRHGVRKEVAMRELVGRYLSSSISRRSFLKGLTTA